ncbi:MAG: discoidin domain-containing protein, partial [bacterium]
MKKHYTLMLISSVMAAVMLVLVFAEKPVLPSRFFGTITINNHPVPSGMSVTAWLGDQKVAETTVEDLGDSSVYVIDVPGDDLDTPELEGGTEGDNIGFKIKDMDAEETAAWHKGTFSRLCLNANPPPSPPVADDQNVVTDEDSTIFITLTAFDPNLDTLTYQILTNPSHGFLSGSPPQVTYTPADNYYGTDSFTFKVNDGTNDSNTATVTITIYPIPDPPVLSIIGSQTIIEGEIRDIEVSAVDPDDDPLQLATENLPAFAQFTDYGNGTGNLSLQPQYGDAGVYTDIMISATDGTYSDSRNIMITVNDATPEPKAGITTGFQYNAAALINGSQLIDYSSYYQQSDEYKPDNVIDDNASTTWRTESGQSINQWITVELPGERVRVIDRISLKEVIGGFIIKYYYGPKDFEIRVSTTGTEEEDFITVYSGTAPKFSGSNSDYEVSFDPVEARYVQLYIFNGYNSNYIETRYFKVWSYAHEGGIVSLKEGIPATIVNYSSQNSTSTRSGLILDEKQTTYWNSVYGESSDQWVTVELGGIQVHTINRIRIRSINNSHVIKDFEIRISASTPDDPAFNTVFTGTAEKTGAIQEFSFDPVQARYIQLYITSVYDGFPLRLSDLFVLTPDSANVARSAGVGAFVVDCTGENKDAEGAIDYDGSTKWTPGTDLNFPQYLTVRLTEGKSYVINRINLNCRNDFRVKDFQIRISTTSSEPTAFTPVFSGTYNPNKEIYTFPPVLAKYVQLYVITPYNTSFGIWINSFKVFSSQLGGRTVPLEDFSVYPGGQIVARDWDFGDGNTSTQQCPLHTYTVPGTYTIHLTVTGDDGLTDTATLDYTVLHYPQPRISWSPQLPHEGQQIQFADSTEETDCIILSRKWQFEGAEHTSSNEPNSNNKYPDNGEYPISLEVMDNQFLSSTAYDTITVINSSPLVDIYKRVILVNDSIRISPTATDSGSADISTLQYHWDLGDGHTYDQKELNYAYDTTGLFDVILTVTDKDGGIGEDTTIFEIVTQEELDNIIIPNTIQSGLEWLAAEQCDNGSWGLYQVNDPRKVGRTGLAVLIFENHAVQHGTDPFDPNYTYCNQVKDGLSYIFSQTEYVSISPQIAGNPDSDGDGLGIRFSNSREMYEPSVAVMAIAASTHPEHIVNQPDCEVHGHTYIDIVTNIIDYIAFGQNDSDCGNYRGGWGYGANTGRSDNSVAGYVIFGLAYAASPPTFGFGLSIPAFVKDELNVWIDYVQNDNSGGAGYESPTNDVNVLKTGHLLQQQAFLGDSLNSPRIQQALSYIENNWNTLYIDPDQAELKIKKQAFFTCMKGFEALGLDSIDTDGDGLRDDSWYNEMAVGLISEQKSEGYWPQHYQRDRDILLSTEWALLVLQKNIPPLLKYDLMVEVLDEATGTYINGAIVEVKGPESRIQSTQGDSAVVFAELLKGEYRLQVTAD